MRKKMLDLANEYLRCARACAAALSTEIGTSDVLRAVNSSNVQREGVISAFGGGSYFVHGSGCRIEAAEMEIEFDFGPGGSVPGFDPWKLYGFAQGRRETHSWLPDRRSFQELLEELVFEGYFKRCGADPNPQLLCPRIRSIDE